MPARLTWPEMRAALRGAALYRDSSPDDTIAEVDFSEPSDDAILDLARRFSAYPDGTVTLRGADDVLAFARGLLALADGVDPDPILHADGPPIDMNADRFRLMLCTSVPHTTNSPPEADPTQPRGARYIGAEWVR